MNCDLSLIEWNHFKFTIRSNFETFRFASVRFDSLNWVCAISHFSFIFERFTTNTLAKIDGMLHFIYRQTDEQMCAASSPISLIPLIECFISCFAMLNCTQHWCGFICSWRWSEMVGGRQRAKRIHYLWTYSCVYA